MSSKGDGTAGDTKSARLDFAGSAPSSSLDAGRVDEPFARSVAALSHQIAERFAKEEEATADPEPPAHTRRAAQVDRGRWFTLALVCCFAAAVVAGGTWLFQTTGLFRPAPAPAAVAAAPPPPHPAPAVPPSPPPPATLTPPAMAPPPVKASAPEPAALPEKTEASLYDILEVQARLKSLGINAGPLDGVAGPQTVTAIKRYQESKGKQQTGTVDRELLGLLRQDTDRSIAEGPPRRSAKP